MTFINLIKINVKEILSREIKLRVLNDRFFDKREEYSYPIKIVIFNDKSTLGYFDPNFHELGFHERLMHASPEVLKNVIRHELAHYITFINHKMIDQPHGTEFKKFCILMGWGKEVYAATGCIDGDPTLLPPEENPMLRKVQKLMALATSHNKHEAEQAMIKSQQLLLKHNIDLESIQEDEKIYLKRILKRPKKDGKMYSIAHILQTFFVNIIFNRNHTFTWLEIVGKATNVEIAEYVANILESKLDLLWKETRKQQPFLKGLVAKNSFFLGVAKGYCDKINSLKTQYDHTTSNALLVIEKQLEVAKEMIYQHLSKSYSSRRQCEQSSMLGQEAGRALNINPAVKNNSVNSHSYLSFQGK